MQFMDLPSSGYHQKYKNLKKKLKVLIYENECFLEELKKSQRKLLKVSCDKSFLLDRLLQFESIGSSSSDSEATGSSESDAESKTDFVVAKKKRLNSSFETTESLSSNTQQSSNSSKIIEIKKKKKNRKLPLSKTGNNSQGASKGSATNSVGTGTRHMTSEQVERHMDSKQAMLHLIPEKTPLTLPVEIFSSEASALDCDVNDGGANESSPNNVAGALSEDDGLIIDLHE